MSISGTCQHSHQTQFCMGVSRDTFLGRIVTKYYPDMKHLFAFVKSLCSICCNEMCGSIMSYCTTVRPVCAPYNITTAFSLYFERQLELWFPRNDSHLTIFLGFDCLKVLTLTGQFFQTFYCLRVLTVAGQYFKVLIDTRLFCQRISVRTQRTSILTSSSSGALIIQTGRCTRQICW